MVLRKPYKFLIRHFRFIHLLLAFMSGYLLTRTNNLLSFYNEYINNSETLVGTGTSNEYFTSLMILLFLGVFIGSIIILVLMKMKDKPILFYIINIIIYVFVVFIYLYDRSMIQKLELSALDIRKIKLASDLTLICFLMQTLSTIILFIRGTGFNIKKFDFGQDLKFDIDESDNEEFEFALNIDKNKIQRNFNKSIRNFKYNYHENKFIINVVLSVIVVVIGVFVYLNFAVYHKLYKEDSIISTSEFSYIVNDSYLINTNYRNKQITDNYLVVVRFKINAKTKKVFEPARVLLHIGKVTFTTTNKFKNGLIDLGNTYSGQVVNNEFKEYLLVFEIPKKYISKKKILSYSDPFSGNYNLKLSPKKLDKEFKSKSKLKDTLKINNGIINNVDFSINNYMINNKIRANYTFCENSKNCYESYEYITPTLTDNYTKSILKIESSIDFHDQVIPNFRDLSDFIESFGTIKYTIGDKTKTMNTKIKEVKPTKSNKEGVYYFEVYDEIKYATKISLIFSIRNNKYEYVLK